MKTLLQWISVCGASLALTLLPVCASAQTTPTPQGTFVADPGVPMVISPSAQGSEYFVLNQDLSLLTHSSVDNSLNGTCAAPSGFSATSATPRTFLNDTQNAYFTAQGSSSANAAVSGFSFINTGLCQPINGPVIAGGVPTYTLTSNDPFHARYFVLSGFNGNGSDTLTVEVNLNNALSGGNYVTQLKTVPLDTRGQYTSMVTDTSAGASGYSLTAITELKTATSPGNLWIYNQNSGAAYKILGPGGVPLPAVGSFLIPAQTNGGGALLVLVNQDNLTATNLSNPPLDTTPFTIIDLGQLIQTFSIQTTGGTVTLPFVTQISATTPYFAMLGAAYNPVTRLVYAVVGGGSLTSVTGSVISYDPFHPGSPNETVVGDVSNVPFSYGAYPQLALSAAAGTLQILTASPTGLYSVGILGKGNLAVAVTGSTFPDTNFKPTYIAANPLLGETYIASTSGQVDILKNTTAKLAATFSLNGPDIATMTQSYSLQATALSPTVDTALRAAPVTITATPAFPGTPFTVSAGPFGNFGLNPSTISMNFPALGVYTLVASIPATANYPAISSNPVNVTVASNFIAGVYPTTLAITAPTNPPTTAVNVLVNLNGSTYAPTGHIDVKDGTGKVVGTTFFNGGALVQPTTVAVTLAQGPNTLTAVYSGDAQNAPTTSPALQVSVGTTVTPTLALTAPGTAFVGNSVSGNVTFRSTTANLPTGLVTIYGLLNTSSTPIALTTVTAAQAFTGAGATFSFTAPAAGTYELYASYAGDTNYASSVTAQQSIVTNPIPVNTTTVVTGSSTQAPGVPFGITVKLTSGTTQATPSGNVVVTAVLNSTGASTTLSTIPAAQAFVSGGYAAQVAIATVGNYTVTANFAGDSNFNGSSNSLAVTVGGTAVGTTLGISGPANVFTGASFITTVTLKATGLPTATITGNVTLMATGYGGTTNSYSLGTMPAASAIASGGVQFTSSIPAAGTYTLAAVYAGDTNYGTSSGSVLITVTVPTTTVGLSGATNQVAGVAFPLTVRLTAQNGGVGTPTGNVVISTVVGTTTTTLATVAAAQALASGGYQAQLTVPSAGSYTVTATYPGDADYSGSTSKLVVTTSLTVPTLQLGGSATGVVGTNSSYSVVLFGFSGTPTVNTTITSLSNNVAGPTTTLTSTGGTVSLAFTTAGAYTVTASFPGDALNAPATSNTVTTVVVSQALAPSYTLTLDSVTPAQAVSVPQSGYTDVAFTLTASNGFTDKVRVSALVTQATDPSGLPYRVVDASGNVLPSDIANPATITLGSTPVHLKLRLYGPSATVAGNRGPFTSGRKVEYAGLTLGLLLLSRARRRLLTGKMAKLLVVVLVVCAAGSVLSGCIGSSTIYNVYLTAQPSNTLAPGSASQTVNFYAYPY